MGTTREEFDAMRREVEAARAERAERAADWLDRVRAMVADVQCPPFVFRVDVLEGTDRVFIQATLARPDTHTGEPGIGYGSKLVLSEHMTRGEVVKKCFVGARDFAEHEVREAFLYRGRRILGPHIDIDDLWEVAERTETRAPTGPAEKP